MLKSFLGLSVLSRGQNVPNIYQGVVCCYECFFFWLGVGVGYLPGQKRLLSLDITMRFTISIKVQSQSLRITLDCSLQTQVHYTFIESH